MGSNSPRRVVRGTTKKEKNQYRVTMGIPLTQVPMSPSIVVWMWEGQYLNRRGFVTVGRLARSRGTACVYHIMMSNFPTISEFRKSLDKDPVFVDSFNLFLNLPVSY